MSPAAVMMTTSLVLRAWEATAALSSVAARFSALSASVRNSSDCSCVGACCSSCCTADCVLSTTPVLRLVTPVADVALSDQMLLGRGWSSRSCSWIHQQHRCMIHSISSIVIVIHPCRGLCPMQLLYEHYSAHVSVAIREPSATGVKLFMQDANPARYAPLV